MSDIFHPEKRSEIMSRIKGKNTKPELLVFRYLRNRKIYFQKHYRSKEGIVLDVALLRKKKAVFIDGDFWHGRTLNRLVERKGKDDFWTNKIRRNMERDQKQRTLLVKNGWMKNGWMIMAVWGSDLARIKTRDKTLRAIESFMSGSSQVC